MTKYKLRDLLLIKNGKPHQHLKDGLYPVFGSGGIMRYASQFLYDKESILLPRKGTLNNIQYCDKPFWVVDTMYYTEVNVQEVVPFFLYCYLKLLDLSNLDSGSTLPSMTFDSYYNIEISLPPLAAQKRIAKVLSDIDVKISLNNRINAKLEQMAKRLYDYWFVQFDFPNEDGKPYKSSGGKIVWSEELKREIPAGWEVKKLDKVLSIRNGKDHKGLNVGKYPVFGTGGIMRYVDDFLYSGESILLPRKGSLDNLMYVNDTFWTIDTMFYTEVLLLHGGKYLFYYIDGSNYLNLESGTGRPSMTASAYYSIDVIVPDESILLNFNKIMTSTQKKKNEIICENKKLTAIRDKLLPMLMNGQISVN